VAHVLLADDVESNRIMRAQAEADAALPGAFNPGLRPACGQHGVVVQHSAAGQRYVRQSRYGVAGSGGCTGMSHVLHIFASMAILVHMRRWWALSQFENFTAFAGFV
jgi:hypothetical protein